MLNNYNRKKKLTTYFIFIVVFFYLLLYPFYLWSSGYPQLNDFVGLILIVSVFLIYKNISLSYYLLISILLMVYIILINFSWALVLNEQLSAFLSSSWYVYNILIMLVFIVLFKQSDKVLNVVKYAVITAILLEFLAVIILPAPGLRALGTFNNPNQLGYFSLLYLTLFYLVIKKKPVNSIVFWLITISGLLTSFYSLSKATILSIIIIIFIEVLDRFKKKANLKNFFFILSLLIILMAFGSNIQEKIGQTEIYHNVQERLLSIGTRDDDTVAGRGYNLITNHPEYLIFGAGEVVSKYRFESFGGEIHSTFGNLLFSYGIIGTTMFIVLLLFLMKGNKFNNYYVLIPLFMYSLTHNGLRNPVFWIILAIIYFYKINIENEKKINSI